IGVRCTAHLAGRGSPIIRANLGCGSTKLPIAHAVIKGGPHCEFQGSSPLALVADIASVVHNTHPVGIPQISRIVDAPVLGSPTCIPISPRSWINSRICGGEGQNVVLVGTTVQQASRTQADAPVWVGNATA